MAGRCFVYVCFPIWLTGTWSAPAQGVWGALADWTSAAGPDAVTAASPMIQMKLEGVAPELSALFFGRISGTMGVTSAMLILVGGLYLFFSRTASRAIILSTIGTYAFLNELLYRLGVPEVKGALPALLGGGFLFGAFFMATDPVSAPKKTASRIIYGILIGLCTTVIRNYSIWNGGLMFSILLANTFASLLDHAVTQYGQKKRAKASSVADK